MRMPVLCGASGIAKPCHPSDEIARSVSPASAESSR
jgi:hypothetical protein